MSEQKNDLGQEILKEINQDETTTERVRKPFLGKAAIPLLAIVTGLIIGALMIAVTSQSVYAAFGESIGKGFATAFSEIGTAYKALFTGAIGDPIRMINAVKLGDAREIRQAFNPFLESLVQSTPYIFAGLAVALGFKSGLFNIGVEGQLFIGAACATFVGYSITGLPAYIHMPLAFLAGALGGALWGFVPGFLKAKTGGHEVINTIMMNFIAIALVDVLVKGPLCDPASTIPRTANVAETARLPLLAPNTRLHAGFLLALLCAIGVWLLLTRLPLGFEIRAVGANPDAAQQAGIRVRRSYVLALGMSGAIAGLAGAGEVLGLNGNLPAAFSSGYGFDGIAVALLARANPIAVIPAALLWGALRNGAGLMQLRSGISVDLINIIQALVIMFVAADAIVRWLYRIKGESSDLVTLRGWGAQ